MFIHTNQPLISSFYIKRCLFFAELAMSQRWSALFCATGAWGGKPIGRVRVYKQLQVVLVNFGQIENFWIYGISLVRNRPWLADLKFRFWMFFFYFWKNPFIVFNLFFQRYFKAVHFVFKSLWCGPFLCLPTSEELRWIFYAGLPLSKLCIQYTEYWYTIINFE